MRARLYRIFFDLDPAHLAGISGVSLFLWAAWLLLPTDTFMTARSYQVMASIMPEAAWGALMAPLGLFQMLTMFAHLPWQVRATAKFCTFVAWLFIAVMFVVSNPASAVVPIYMVFTAISFGAFVRRVIDKDRH